MRLPGFFLLTTLCGLVAATPTWSTGENVLLLNGDPVLLHGFGSTCTEYLLRGIGMKCFAINKWSNSSEVIATVNTTVTDAIVGYFKQMKKTGVIPAVRIPLTAAYWLDIETPPWADNRAKYPHLALQYQRLVRNLVDIYTSAGAVAILDLHWNDDVDEQCGMALKKPESGGKSNVTGNSLDFWDSVAAMFKDNKLVWYELYNEPHINDFEVYKDGSDAYAGMVEMYKVVRTHATDSMIVIAGMKDYAYDTDSLISLDKEDLRNVVYNWHPYMGQAQSGDAKKSAQGFSDMVSKLRDAGVTKPLIITEFGQSCCDTDGACFDYPGTWDSKTMGYVEAIINICEANAISFLPWSWRPTATTSNCEAGRASGNDMNGEHGNAVALTTNDNKKGANFAKLFTQYW